MSACLQRTLRYNIPRRCQHVQCTDWIAAVMGRWGAGSGRGVVVDIHARRRHHWPLFKGPAGV